MPAEAAGSDLTAAWAAKPTGTTPQLLQVTSTLGAKVGSVLHGVQGTCNVRTGHGNSAGMHSQTITHH